MIQAVNQPCDPTPEEIAQRCAEIQANWTPQEHRSRRIGNVSLTRFDAPGVEAAARSLLEAKLSQHRERQSRKTKAAIDRPKSIRQSVRVVEGVET